VDSTFMLRNTERAYFQLSFAYFTTVTTKLY